MFRCLKNDDMKHRIILAAAACIAAVSCQKNGTEQLRADFLSDVQEVIIGEPVAFKDLSSGSPSRWDWTFEDGEPGTSVLSEPSVVWYKAGTFSVSLKVQRSGNSDEIVKERYITVAYPSIITADFSVDRTEVTNMDEIVFTDMSLGYPDSWKWTFTSPGAEPVSSSERNPVIKLEPGLWTVRLEVSNPNAKDTKEVKDMIKVIDKYAVSAGFTAASRTTYAGGKIHFRDASIGSASEWKWTFEGGVPASSSEKEPVVTYSAPGQYKVAVTVSNEVNSSEKSIDGFVNVISADGLMFFLPFDGNSDDCGPNALNPSTVTVGNKTILYDAQSREVKGIGSIGTAARFSGGDKTNYSILSIPDGLRSIFDNTGDFTVSVWARVPTLAGGKKSAIFHQGCPPGATSADPVPRQSWFRFTTDTKNLVFCVEYKGKGGNWAEYTGTRMDDGTWHHFACVYKRNGEKRDSYLYIDGQKAVESLGRDNKIIDSWPFYIGCNSRITNGEHVPENYMNGDIDDFILYNRALGEEEVQALANN